MRALLLSLLIVLSGCASRAPAPVVDAQSAPPVPTIKSNGSTYIVKRGDTLYSIARAHGLSPTELSRLNQLSDARISIGQVLVVSTKDSGVNPSESPAAGSAVNPAVNPIVTAPTIESKPLDPPSGEIKSAPSIVAPSSALLKTEPKALKLPYSEQNVALLQRSDAIQKNTAQNSAPESATPAPTQTDKPIGVTAPAQVDTQLVASNDGVEWSWPANGNLTAKFVEGGNKGVEIAGKSGDAVYAAAAGKVTYRGSGVRGYGNLIIIKHNEKYLSAYAHNKSILVEQGQSVKRGQKIAELGATGADKPMLHFEIRRFGKPTDPLELLPPRIN
jgi:lipoprotein NlpD